MIVTTVLLMFYGPMIPEALMGCGLLNEEIIAHVHLPSSLISLHPGAIMNAN